MTSATRSDGAPDLSLRPEGDLDLHQALAFEESAIALLRGSDGGRLVIDLGAVAFVDSTGLGSLVAILNEARELDRDLVLTGLTDAFSRLLDITGLLAVFTIEPARSTAD
jgi:anti-sigma B factor antagonist